MDARSRRARTFPEDHRVHAIAKLVEDAKTGEWDIAWSRSIRRAQRRGLAPAHIVVDLTFLVRRLDDRERGRGRPRRREHRRGARRSDHSLLQREFKQAQIVQAEKSRPRSPDQGRQAQVYAQNRTCCSVSQTVFPGRACSKTVFPREMSSRCRRAARALATSANSSSSPRIGTVQRAIETAKLRGVRVAP